jgi:hypothetical protein
MTRRTARTIAIAVAIVLAALGCQGAPARAPLAIQLQPLNSSGVSGTATLVDLGNGRTRVEVKVDAEGNASMPSHIHAGTCADLVPQPKYPLENVTNGAATTEVASSLDDLIKQPNVVMTHKSNDQMRVYTSCGEIR